MCIRDRVSGYIEGQYYLDENDRLMVVKRDYENLVIGMTKERTKGGVVIKKSEPIYENLPVSEPRSESANLNSNQEARIRGMLGIQDSARDLLQLERSNEEESDIVNKRNELRTRYANFVRRYGNLNKAENVHLMASDPDATFLTSLETQRGGRWYGRDIFSRRMLQGVNRSPVQTAVDAMSATLDDRGRLDFEHMGALLGRSALDVRTDLSKDDYIFHNPDNNTWEPSDLYLAGATRMKLASARTKAESDPEYEKNVKKLETVQPPRLSVDDISVHLGATWIPEEWITQWTTEALSGNSRYGSAEYRHDLVLGHWIRVKKLGNNVFQRNWGTPHMPASEICLLYTSPSPRDRTRSRMPSSA